MDIEKIRKVVAEMRHADRWDDTRRLTEWADALEAALREAPCDSSMAVGDGDGGRREPTEPQTPPSLGQPFTDKPDGNSNRPLPKGLQGASRSELAETAQPVAWRWRVKSNAPLESDWSSWIGPPLPELGPTQEAEYAYLHPPAQPASVPGRQMRLDDDSEYDKGYADGWNAYRAAMLRGQTNG